MRPPEEAGTGIKTPQHVRFVKLRSSPITNQLLLYNSTLVQRANLGEEFLSKVVKFGVEKQEVSDLKSVKLGQCCPHPHHILYHIPMYQLTETPKHPIY